MASILGIGGSMDQIHLLGYAHHQLERVMDYLHKQELRGVDAVTLASIAAARMLVTFARNAVAFEHDLLERVHVYKLTGR